MSWPDTVRWVSRPKKSWPKSIPPPFDVRGRFVRSRVETRNMAPAPSASLAVMIGVWTQKNPRSSKKRCSAIDRQCRTRVMAPKVLVRGRRWATSRRYSNECCLGDTG